MSGDPHTSSSRQAPRRRGPILQQFSTNPGLVPVHARIVQYTRDCKARSLWSTWPTHARALSERTKRTAWGLRCRRHREQPHCTGAAEHVWARVAGARVGRWMQPLDAHGGWRLQYQPLISLISHLLAMRSAISSP